MFLSASLKLTEINKKQLRPNIPVCEHAAGHYVATVKLQQPAEYVN